MGEPKNTIVNEGGKTPALTRREKAEAEKSQKKAATLKLMEADRQQLLVWFPFIALVLMHLDLVPITDDVNCPTTMTDGQSIYVNCNFYETLDDAERLFVLAHETWHCILQHFFRLQGRDRKLFDIAIDLEIHFFLSKEKNFKEPFVLPHNPNWDGMSAEQIYSELEKLQDSKRLKKLVISTGFLNTDGALGKSFDRHLYKNSGAVDDPSDNGGHGGNNGKGEPQSQNEKQKGGGGQDKEQSQGGGGGQSEDQSQDANQDNRSGEKGESEIDLSQISANISESNAENIRQIVIQAAQVMERQPGSVPGYLKQIVEQYRRPEINWRELLKQYVTSCFGGTRHWLPPARRYVGMGIYMPSRRDERFEAVVAIDTSGSMMNDLPIFFAELTGLLNTFGCYDLTVIQCDAEIQKVEKFSSERPLPADYKWEADGCGGTDFCPPFRYLAENHLNPTVFIYFTDGYGNAPSQPPCYPVIWMLADGGSTPASWGRVIPYRKATKGWN